MLTTTREFSRHARSTRLMWPACRAPIVGTRPIVWPSRRQARAVASIAAGVSMTAGALASAVFDLFARFLRFRRRGGRAVGRVAVLRAGESAGANLFGVPPGSLADLLREVGIPLDELRGLAGGQA